MWFAALVLLLTLGVAQVEPAAPIPLDEYWRRIEALAESLDGAEQNQRVIRAAADELDAIEAVLLPDGQALPVDNDELVAILRRDDVSRDDLQAARARLAALQRARQQAVPVTGQTFERLDEILSRSEFERATAGRAASVSLLQRAWEWLWDKLSPWLDRAGRAPGAEPLITLFSLGVMLATLYYIFRSSWQQWAAEGRSAGKGGYDDEANLSSSEALERARALSAGDDYRRAVRYLYLSTLLWLDERRLLHYDPACTNREFLRQVSVNASLHEALLPVVDFFDRVWYGFAPLDGRGYVTFARQVEQVRQAGGQE